MARSCSNFDQYAEETYSGEIASLLRLAPGGERCSVDMSQFIIVSLCKQPRFSGDNAMLIVVYLRLHSVGVGALQGAW